MKKVPEKLIDQATLALRRAFFRDELRELIASEEWALAEEFAGSFEQRAKEKLLIGLLDEAFLMGVLWSRDDE